MLPMGKRAESIARFMTKGKQVCVSGEVTISSYQSRDGGTASSLSVRVNEVDFFGDSRTDNRDEPQRDTSQTRRDGPARQQPPRHDDLDDEIPF